MKKPDPLGPAYATLEEYRVAYTLTAHISYSCLGEDPKVWYALLLALAPDSALFIERCTQLAHHMDHYVYQRPVGEFLVMGKRRGFLDPEL